MNRPLTTTCPIPLMAQAQSADTSWLNEKMSPQLEEKATTSAADETCHQNNTDYPVLLPKNLQPGVNRLLLDGTPPIVPDTNKVAPMPNAWKGPRRVPVKEKKLVTLYNESNSEPVLQ